MTHNLSSFRKLDRVDGVYVAEKDNLRCMAVVLHDGSVCLFNPVQGMCDEAIESLERIGEVKFLLAPNHYHNKALKEYVGVFPKASLCAPDGAIPRLQKITGLRPGGLDGVKALLSKQTEFIGPQGLKTGEVWLRVKGEHLTAWLVVDAFCGPKIDTGKTDSATPDLLKTFPNYGVGEKDVYVSWVNGQIGADQPDLLVPCHGSLVRAHDLPRKLKSLVKDSF